MVELFKNSVGFGVLNDFYKIIIMNKGLKFLMEIECIFFFGGVVDCILMGVLSDFFRYGDIGLLLGKVIVEFSLMIEKKYIEFVEIIWVIVVGVGLYIVEISGSMIIYIEKIFLVKNILILKFVK